MEFVVVNWICCCSRGLSTGTGCCSRGLSTGFGCCCRGLSTGTGCCCRGLSTGTPLTRRFWQMNRLMRMAVLGAPEPKLRRSFSSSGTSRQPPTPR